MTLYLQDIEFYILGPVWDLDSNLIWCFGGLVFVCFLQIIK